MAITALNSAATGLRALSTEIDVISNNLANAETASFKGSRVNFEDLYYQMLRQPGIANQSNSDISPDGLFVGLGTKISNTELDMTQGSMQTTNGQLDLGIQGAGFFKIKIMDTIGTPPGTGYTRYGSLIPNSNGNLVVNMGQGYELIPPITLPKGATNITVGQDGTVTCVNPGATAPVQIGTIKLTQLINPQGMQLLGGNVYIATVASGTGVDSTPGQLGAGTIQQGFLEESNVDPVSELVNLIKTQRSFELNSQSIQTADQALQTIDNLKR
jgi:flagellar basal-body rod protein FlgG